MGKKRLLLVGNFVELGHDDVGAPSLVAARGQRSAANKAQVLAYLRSGVMFIGSPGLDEDVLDPSKTAGSATVLTDGVYAWPKTLAYYLDTYDVALPEDFELHMRRNGWKVPDTIDKSSLEYPP